MVPSVDFMGSASLLCAEDESSIFDDEFESSDRRKPLWVESGFGGVIGDGFLSSGLGLPVHGEEFLGVILEREIQHLPCGDYLERLRSGVVDLGARKLAVDWISKVQSHYNFGPLCAYLSINYLDRFLSAYELAKGKDWMMQLLSVACLSLAAKMEETDVPLCLDLQIEDAKFVFEAMTIQRMELLVLSTLKWRMQSVTPFSFLEHFLSEICFDQNIPPRCLFPRAFQLILGTAKGIDFLEFRPSEIAAAVAISVASQTYSTEDSEKAISLLIQHVEKERLAKCIEKVQDLASMGFGATNGSAKMSLVGGGVGGSSGFIPHSPIGVLDAAACLSYRSSDDTTNSTTCATSTHNSLASNPKRRRHW